MARLRILFAVSECFPFAKTGGLGDVAGALPIALAARRHDVRVVMPRYPMTAKHPATRRPAPMAVPAPYGGEAWCAVWESELGGKVPVYLLEHEQLFHRDGVYGDKHGEFGDNLARYGFLSRGALALCRHLGWTPDVIHVHDWPTAIVPLYLDTVERHGPLGRVATVLSVHNMGYQGWFPRSEAAATGVPPEAHGALEWNGTINLLKAGLERATAVSTVSPTYAREIQSPEGGAGLDPVLAARGDRVVGILNGVDDVAWDPRRDPHLPATFGPEDLTGKSTCKAALQREVGLPDEPGVPLIGVVSRLAQQKGIDILAAALPGILDLGAQVVVLGSGETWAENFFRSVAASHPRFRAHIGMNEGLAHRIEAGSDLFLMPSRYEPCGLNQLYSQRYGTLPVVRSVGGLADTVEHDVTGFRFEALDGGALRDTVAWAVHVFRTDRRRFRQMQWQAMTKPMGWGHAARPYEALYRYAIGRRRAAEAERERRA
jgi:starch synthase